MIRLFGALLIVCASLATGFSASAMYKQQAAQLEAFLALISHICGQIDGFLSPLERIYAEFKNSTLEKCGFLPELRRCGGVGALSKCKKSLCLTHEEVEELEKFFLGLGNHGISEEIRHCKYYEGKISAFAADAKEHLGGKVKICRSFGLLVGLMISVVLL